MLKKLIDGKEIVCSDQEEALIRKRWALNDRFPEYAGHLVFDGINEPSHNIPACRNHHQRLVKSIIENKLEILRKEIEAAQEDGLDTSALFARRKHIKSFVDSDLSWANAIEDLKAHLEEVKKL